MSEKRRIDLVVLDLLHHALARLGSGFGKYPLGVAHAIEQLLPLVPEDAPCRPEIDRAWSKLQTAIGQP